jgi:hypothetical protein
MSGSELTIAPRRRGPALLGAAVLAAALLAALLGAPRPAPAVVPGANGQIAFLSFRDGNAEVYVMNADGSGQENRSMNGADD